MHTGDLVAELGLQRLLSLLELILEGLLNLAPHLVAHMRSDDLVSDLDL